MDKLDGENAQESLAAIENIMKQTRKAIASSHANSLLILWGVIWVVNNTVLQFYPDYAHYVSWVFVAVGGVGTFLIHYISHTEPWVRTFLSQKTSRRLWWFWILLFVYAFIWLKILAPFNGLQINAVFSTAAMFGYIVMGLWFGSYFMVWLGLAVTATTLIGFYFIPHYYCLWMAVTGGGAILCTGLYIRFRWR
jgi:hypothetical protein